MITRSIFKTTSLVAATLILGASSASATTVQVPEPSALSVYGIAVAGLVIAGRWLRRK